MILVRLAGILTTALILPGLLGAQGTAAPGKSRCAPEAALPPLLKSALCTISLTYHKPLHPVIRGIAPGGGLGAGLEYTVRPAENWRAAAAATATVRESWSAEVGGGYRSTRARMEAYARFRDLPQLAFFGLGTESDLADHSIFRLRDSVAGVLGSVRPVEWLTIGARVEGLWPEVRSSQSSRFPSIEARFDESEIPGLSAQPNMVRSQASVDIAIPPAAGEALQQGAHYRIAYAVYSDQELDQFSFRRLDVEVQQRFALLGAYRRLTLHGWLSISDTDAGHDMPFYLQPTLGGKWNLLGVHEELIGSDGTQATLRGFRNFRFRDRQLLLLQGEYRIPLWGPLDATVFAEAGKVTSRREDLDLRGLKRSLGFSLSVMRGPATAARVDVGFGGGEGVQAFLTIHREAVP